MASDRQLQRLGWLDAEITRYRNVEARLASFFGVFLAAVFYVFIDNERREAIDFLPSALIVLVIWLYALFAVFSLGYAHFRLNYCRKQRLQLCRDIPGEPDRDSEPRGPFGLWEGWGMHVIAGLILSVLAFAAIDTAVVLNEPDEEPASTPNSALP